MPVKRFISVVSKRCDAFIVFNGCLGIPREQHEEVDCKTEEYHDVVPHQPKANSAI